MIRGTLAEEIHLMYAILLFLVAIAILNSTTGMPDTTKACKFLETAIEVDPQFTAAYVHLGQVRLGMAQDLETARRVIELYDRGLQCCRTKEEVNELSGMRILAVAQVEAANSLKMETLSMV